ARKPYARKFGRAFCKISGAIDHRPFPGVAAVVRLEHQFAGNEVPVLFIAEVDLADGFGGVERILAPGRTAVIRCSEESVVARNKTAGRSCEINRDKVLGRPAVADRPGSLCGSSANRCQDENKSKENSQGAH